MEVGWAATGGDIIDWENSYHSSARQKPGISSPSMTNPADRRRFARRAIEHIKALSL
jgi:hypothetical protein